MCCWYLAVALLPWLQVVEWSCLGAVCWGTGMAFNWDPILCFFSYVQTGCTSLKLILQRFLPLITDILAAPPSVGVDISREER